MGLRARSLLFAVAATTLATALALPAAGQDYKSSSATPQADPRAGDTPTRKKMSTYEVDERTAKRLQAALLAVSEEDWDEAERQIRRLRPRSLNPLERQKASEIRAFVAFGRGDNDAARQHFEDAIAEGEMTDEERAQTRYRIMQLYLADQMWPQVIEQMKRWFEIAPDPSPAAYYVLALAYYQNNDLEGALEPARQACTLSEAPEESWLQLLLAIHLTKKDYESAIPVLEELVVRFPKKRYWLNLSTVYGALGNYDEALVPLQLAYTQGALTEDTELRRLAQLLLFLGLPYRAAEVIETELAKKRIEEDAEIYEILGNSWIAAREYDKTVEPLTKAAEMSGDGDLYVRLAQVQIQREKWVAASVALGRALELGDLQKPGEAKLLMGIANYNSERPQQARTWFTRARSHEESRSEADQWLMHLDREQQQSG